MTTAADILPSNAGPFERAVADAASRVLPVPLREIVDPAVTPAAFLPFLAAHESVDLWDERWPEERKRAMIAEAVSLAARKGTRIGAVRFLSYVDAELLDVLAYPKPFFMGSAWIGHTPIAQQTFTATYLVKTDLELLPDALVMGSGFLADTFLCTPNTEKLDLALVALRAAKAPETEIRVDFQHRRPLTIDDAPRLDAGHYLGEFVDRHTL